MSLLRLSLFLSATIVMSATWAQAESTPTVKVKTVSFEAALVIAESGLKTARGKGCSVAICVVDYAARQLVLLRDDAATEQFVTGACRKAWTAANLRASTRDMLRDVETGGGDNGQLPEIDKALFLMGGVLLKDGDAVVGAVGAAGCVSGPDDDLIARSVAEEFTSLLSK